MFLMTNNPMCASLLERYLRTRGRRYFRGHHDGEYFFVTGARSRRLHVHFEISPAHDDVLVIRVIPGYYFPAADRPWLTYFSERWNRQDRHVTAVVHGSSDPQRIGVVARRSQWIRKGFSFEDFASFVDGAIADAVELFEELSPVGELPSTKPPLLRDAG
jgi:putative sensory transduction regulator